jgi:uncharacterized protein YjbI with pentapeptide repeats
LVVGVIYLLAWYVPGVLVRHKADPTVETAWIGAVATLLGVGATAAVAIFAFWYSRLTLQDQGKQLDKTLAEQRTRTLNERFATAAGQLGSDKPPAVRLAGVYAMAGLADDWPENRQTCADVLCAYLRLPYEPDPGDEARESKRLAFRASREVRHTVIRVITDHLSRYYPAEKSWRGLNFDFTGVVFDGGDFTAAVFSGGWVSFTGAVFSGGWISFTSTKFTDDVSFHGAKFSGATVSFAAEFSGGEVDFSGAVFSGGHVSFGAAEFSRGEVTFRDAVFSGGTVDFFLARFIGSTVSFRDAKFTGGALPTTGLSHGTVSFGHAQFSDGEVSFTGAVFSADIVRFDDAEFFGGTVDFRDPGDWSHRPAFPWTSTPPPGVKLPKKEDLTQE